MNATKTEAFNPIIEKPITDTINSNNDNHNVPLINEYNDSSNFFNKYLTSFLLFFGNNLIKLSVNLSKSNNI